MSETGLREKVMRWLGLGPAAAKEPDHAPAEEATPVPPQDVPSPPADEPAPAQEVPQPPRQGGYLAICGIAKDERNNLIEWIAYHLALGVERVYLYDNNSLDGTADMIRPLVDKGVVEYVPWPDVPGQLSAYNDFAARFGHLWTWTAFIDIDEFIHPLQADSIPGWLQAFEPYAGVAIQWLNFGPSGMQTRPEGLGIDHYVHRFPEIYAVHGHNKSIIKMAHYVNALSPHAFQVDGVIVNERSEPLAGEYSLVEPMLHDQICINHYYTRSREDWLAKLQRGCADTLVDSRVDIWYTIYERDATVHDDRITRFSGATKAKIAELTASDPAA